ncbi:hypothetical protein L2E82_01142 [Cichorium intybus]|uniref:Uncharacterized protein n=1 Tax=Cichorium intybus TaxID=13427 RepID=A0ACB9GXS8_CICIN|nr:hypothetical protein L2E82_01142 [Cichorium intybus]
MAVYGLNPLTPLDLAALDTTTKFSKEAYDMAADIQSIHKRIHDKITKTNDLLKFPAKRRSKLSPRSDGPFHVLSKVNDNAYKIELPGDSSVSTTFNVADLQPYHDPDELIPSLRSNFSDDREDDRQVTQVSEPTSPLTKWVSLVQLA